MPRNVFLDESRSERFDLGLPFLRQLRASPTVAAVLLEEKPTTMTWGDFALLSMLGHSFMARILRGDLRGAKSLLVRLVGSLSGEPDGRQER